MLSVSKAGYMLITIKQNIRKLKLMLMDSTNENNMIGVLLVFTNMYSVAMVTMLFSSNSHLNKYYFGNFNTNSCW